MSGVTLTGGRSCNGLQGCTGGGVENRGRLTLDDVLVTGNAAAPGDDQTTPGTGASGGNGGDGGGVFNAAGAQLTVTDSGIVGNAAGTGGAGADGLGNSGGSGGEGGAGGGIYNNGGSVALSNSTVSGNTAGTGGTGGLGDSSANPGTSGGDGGRGGFGGGIVTVPGLSGAGTLDLTNVTVAGNTIGPGGSGGQGFPSGGGGPGGLGGGIASTSTASLTNVTVAGNTGGLAGDGVLVAGGVMSEYGSLIAGNGGSGGQNCAGGIVNRGANITYPAQSTSDCPGVVADPKLGALGAHGGRVDTIALGPGSAAIDAEPAGGACPGTDERGVPRPQRAACDAGAYESAPPGLTHVNATATGPTTATVTADVDPHLRDTTVVVRFGPSASYGSSSQVVDAGSSGAAVQVSVPVTGLTPGASYHLALVATNADGTTSSADQTLTVGGAGRGGACAGAHQRASVGASLAPRAAARDLGSAAPGAGRNNVHVRTERSRHGHAVVHTDSARTPHQRPLRGAQQAQPPSPKMQPRLTSREPRVAGPRGRRSGPVLRTALQADPAEARQLHRGNRRGRPNRRAVRSEDAELHDRPSLVHRSAQWNYACARCLPTKASDACCWLAKNVPSWQPEVILTIADFGRARSSASTP